VPLAHNEARFASFGEAELHVLRSKTLHS